MIVRFVFLWLLLAGLTACGEGKGAYRLSDEQLAHLMIDLAMSEAAFSDLSQEKADSLRQVLLPKMVAVYGLSEAELKAEIQKLELDADKLNSIMGRMRMITDSIR